MEQLADLSDIPREESDFQTAKRRFERLQEQFFAEINEVSTFDVTAYCYERVVREPWVTVDIGPGIKPSGLNRSYRGESRYVAFEPCLNPLYAPRRVVERTFVNILADRPDENISLKDALHIHSGSSGKLVFMGKYYFPDSEASEVFISNVFDDNTIHADSGKNPKIVAEAFRMLQPGGKCIIQDTAYNMTEWLGSMLEEAGFELVFGQPAYVSVADEVTAERYQAQFIDLIQGIGLHYKGHEHLALLIAQKPKETD